MSERMVPSASFIPRLTVFLNAGSFTELLISFSTTSIGSAAMELYIKYGSPKRAARAFPIALSPSLALRKEYMEIPAFFLFFSTCPNYDTD